MNSEGGPALADVHDAYGGTVRVIGRWTVSISGGECTCIWEYEGILPRVWGGANILWRSSPPTAFRCRLFQRLPT